jgi:cation:H+ antiporter
MLINCLAIIAGFVLLIWSADRFISGAAAVADHMNVSPLIIGLTIVGFGTSAPEMLVAIFASAGGNPGLAVGNALGSNITNIALVLGVTAIIMPIDVHSRIIRKELPMLLLAMVLMLVLILDNYLGRTDGILLVGALVLLMWWISRQALLGKNDSLSLEYEEELPKNMPMSRAIIWLLIGMALLLASSKLLVWGAVNIAYTFGISDLVIGLTIIAIGTSLPELAASIASAIKNEHDIAIGNVVGSNMFNTLAVLGIPGILAPAELPEGVMDRDIPVVFILTIALIIMAYGFRGAGRINRFEGLVLCSAFLAYQAYLYITTVSGV